MASSEPLYSSQQIHIPPELPSILKEWTKNAIKTQPADPISWSASYFAALAKGEVPPCAKRLETSAVRTRLTPGLLQTLHAQLGSQKTVSKTELTKKWNDICLDMQQLDELIWVDFDNKTDIEWEQFLALGCSALAGNITQALVQLTKILGANDDDRIPLDVFERNYRYLAKIDGDIKDAQLQEVLDFLSDPGNGPQGGMVHANHFLRPECPKLGN